MDETFVIKEERGVGLKSEIKDEVKKEVVLKEEIASNVKKETNQKKRRIQARVTKVHHDIPTTLMFDSIDARYLFFEMVMGSIHSQMKKSQLIDLCFSKS